MAKVNVPNSQSRVDGTEQHPTVGGYILHHDPTGSLGEKSLLTRKTDRVERGIAAGLAGGEPDLVSARRPVEGANPAPSPREHSLRQVEADHAQGVISHFHIVIEKRHKLTVPGHARCQGRERIDLVQ